MVLSCLQAVIPPLLRTNDLVFAFNRYAIPFANHFKFQNFSKESLIPVGDSLLFSKGGLGPRTLGEGWNDQEPWGIWSQAKGRLIFNNLGAGIQRIQVQCKALIGPKQATQTIVIYANQKIVKKSPFEIRQSIPSLLICPQPLGLANL